MAGGSGYQGSRRQSIDDENAKKAGEAAEEATDTKINQGSLADAAEKNKKAQTSPTPAPEEDPEKMSPLARAAYEAKKKRLSAEKQVDALLKSK